MKIKPVRTPYSTLLKHKFAGGRSLKRYVADLPESGRELRISIGIEPAGADEKCIRHISFSVGNEGRIGVLRMPTIWECVEAIKALCNQHYLPFDMHFEEEGSRNGIRHFWEKR